MLTPPSPRVVITSYGARWNDPPRHPAATLLLDVSDRLWDPAAFAETGDLVPLTGLDAAVRDHVLGSPEAARIVEETGHDVLALLAARAPELPVHLHVHCWYGRHRAVAVSEAVGDWLAARDVPAEVRHRHLARPFIHRDPSVSETCGFCLIVAGRAPATLVRAWDDAVAVEPPQPSAAGHVLVIPRRHVANATDDPVITAATMGRAAELAAEAQHGLSLSTSQDAPPAARTTTPRHLHIALIPHGTAKTVTTRTLDEPSNMAGVAGVEPAASGFGDRRSGL